MKITLGSIKTLEKARDCYLMAAAVTDLTCNLTKAVNAVVHQDSFVAKEFLNRAVVNAQSMKDLYPGRSNQAHKILKDVKGIVKSLPKHVPDKKEKFLKRIWDVEGQATNLRAGTKVHCNVPLPFQIKTKKRT